jgi:hypothetical protein
MEKMKKFSPMILKRSVKKYVFSLVCQLLVRRKFFQKNLIRNLFV